MICFEPRKFLTAKEVAACLGGKCTQATVNALIRAGKLKGKKVARAWRILPEWLDEYMAKPANSQSETEGYTQPNKVARTAKRPKEEPVKDSEFIDVKKVIDLSRADHVNLYLDIGWKLLMKYTVCDSDVGPLIANQTPHFVLAWPSTLGEAREPADDLLHPFSYLAGTVL